MRMIRAERETEVQVEEPMGLVLRPRENLFISSTATLEVHSLGPISIRGRLSELGEESHKL